jgi:tetratricopeptide (TPR) repeat protein
MMARSALDYDWYVGAINLTFWMVAGMVAYLGHGGRVVELPPEEEPRKGRRRRSRGQEGWQAPERPEARSLPWPRSMGGRAASALALALVLVWLVWVPARSAMAQQLVDEGNAVAMEGNGRAAVVRFAEAKERDPGWPDAWERYGLVSGIVHDLEGGVKALRHAMELAPMSFRPVSSLGQLYAERGRWEEAAEQYRRTLELFPNHTTTMLALADAYRQMGESDRAAEVYHRMVEVEKGPYNRYRALEDVDVDTSFAHAHYELGRAAARAWEEGRREDGLEAALAEYNAALEIVVEYFRKAEEMDRMFAALKRPRKYRGEEMRHLGALLRWRRAGVYERLGQPDEAEQDRVRARELWPQVEEAAAAEGEAVAG